MSITISNVRRPGVIYDSSKLSVLGNMIAGSIKKRTGGKYIAISTIKGKKIKFNLKVLNEKGEYIKPNRGEQSILAGRISNFLINQGISSDVKVV